MNVKQTREHMKLIEDMEEIKSVLKAIHERLDKLEAKRRPGRPRKSREDN